MSRLIGRKVRVVAADDEVCHFFRLGSIGCIEKTHVNKEKQTLFIVRCGPLSQVLTAKCVRYLNNKPVVVEE